MAAASKPHVVIIGGGFAGLNAAKQLRDADVAVTIVDQHNHHTFQPLLYQVATASLSPADIAGPIRAILRRQTNLSVILAEVTGIDLARGVVHMGTDELAYDYLIYCGRLDRLLFRSRRVGKIRWWTEDARRRRAHAKSDPARLRGGGARPYR